jgi:hypothetical protein
MDTVNQPPVEREPVQRLFDHIYLSADETFWSLSPRQRSKEALRRICTLSRSLPLRMRVDLAANPHVNGAGYGTAAAFALIENVDAFLVDFHAQYPDHPNPAGLFDPLHRMERWP